MQHSYKITKDDNNFFNVEYIFCKGIFDGYHCWNTVQYKLCVSTLLVNLNLDCRGARIKHYTYKHYISCMFFNKLEKYHNFFGCLTLKSLNNFGHLKQLSNLQTERCSSRTISKNRTVSKNTYALLFKVSCTRAY